MIVKAPKFSWGGLNTTADATGLPLLECVALQDMRLVGKVLEQRLGIVRVGKVGGTAKALDFTAASSDMLSNAVDTRVWALGLYWSVEFAIEPDSASGTQGLFVAGHTTPAISCYIDGSDDIIFKVWDTNNDAVTATVGAAAASLQTVQVTRSAATLTMRLNNGTATTDTLHATRNVRTPVGDLRVARDDGANYYDGTVDYLRVLSTVKANHADRLVRLSNPRSAHVLADYDMNMTGTLVYDRSRYGNHLIATNITAAEEVTSLCHNPAPIRAISMGVDEATKRKQLLVCAGGNYYLAWGD